MEKLSNEAVKGWINERINGEWNKWIKKIIK